MILLLKLLIEILIILCFGGIGDSVCIVVKVVLNVLLIRLLRMVIIFFVLI